MAKNTKTELEHWVHGMFILGLLIATSLVIWVSVIGVVATLAGSVT